MDNRIAINQSQSHCSKHQNHHKCGLGARAMYTNCQFFFLSVTCVLHLRYCKLAGLRKHQIEILFGSSLPGSTNDYYKTSATYYILHISYHMWTSFSFKSDCFQTHHFNHDHTVSRATAEAGHDSPPFCQPWPRISLWGACEGAGTLAYIAHLGSMDGLGNWGNQRGTENIICKFISFG